MKNNLVLLCLFLFSKLYSAEIEMQSNSRVKYDEFIFTNKSKYIIINHEGQWTDSIGNYGSNECKGLIKKNENDVVYFLDVICELVDQNNQVTWRKFERTGSQIERGVGVSTIIDTTSKYKDELIGTKCTYAVNRTKDMVFGKSICKVSDELFKKLIE
tara:strand:+ start:235 stop:708 length:474 start_codon:yes stop_codon:yes gene_type:complete